MMYFHRFFSALIACASLILLGGPASAEVSSFATVKLVGCSQTSETCYLQINGVIPNPAGCATASQARWQAASPVGEEFLSLAMSAFAAGKEVSFFVDQNACVANQPSIGYFNVR